MAKYKPSKDSKKHIVKKMQETEGLNTGFGEYDESTGGGKPFEKGNSNTRTTRENGKTRQAQNPNTNQPRTNDGKFTYKSVNGESIDPKYGPSRGTTVPPTLTGGVNGIQIEDVEKQFSQKSGSYWDKYKGSWYNKGGKVMTQGLSTKISGEAVWNMAKEYDKSLGEYKGESENWKTKTGKKSASEVEAAQQVKKSKEQQNVIEKETGGIETVGKKFKEFVESKKKPVEEEVKEEAKEEVKEEPVVQDVPFGSSGKLTQRHADNFKKQMKAELGSDFDNDIDDATIEEFLLSLSDEDLQKVYDYKA